MAAADHDAQIAFQEARIALGQDPQEFAPPALELEDDSDNFFAPAQEGFEFKETRIIFAGKVYSLLAFQQIAVAGIVALLIYCQPIKEWIGLHAWALLVSFFFGFSCLIVFYLCPKIQRNFPGNLIPFILYALGEGATLGTAGIFFEKPEAAMSGIAFLAILLSCLAFFSIQPFWDFKKAIIGSFLPFLIVSGFGALATITKGKVPLGQIVGVTIAVSYVIIFSVYGMFRILAKEHRKDIKPNDVVFAALTLFVDTFCPFIWA